MLWWIVGLLLFIIILLLVMIVFSTVYITMQLHIDNDNSYLEIQASVYFLSIYKKNIPLDDFSLQSGESKQMKNIRPLLKRLRQEVQLEWLEGDIVLGMDDVILNAILYPILITLKEWLNREKNWQLNVATDFTGNEWYVKGSCMISIKLVKTIKAWKLRKEYV